MTNLSAQVFAVVCRSEQLPRNIVATEWRFPELCLHSATKYTCTLITSKQKEVIETEARDTHRLRGEEFVVVRFDQERFQDVIHLKFMQAATITK